MQQYVSRGAVENGFFFPLLKNISKCLTIDCCAYKNEGLLTTKIENDGL